MVITGIVIVVATFIAIIKQFETRLVLLIIRGLRCAYWWAAWVLGTTAFVKELTNPGLVPTICTVLGFSYVMEYTKCTEHMVYFISAGLKR